MWAFFDVRTACGLFSTAFLQIPSKAAGTPGRGVAGSNRRCRFVGRFSRGGAGRSRDAPPPTLRRLPLAIIATRHCQFSSPTKKALATGNGRHYGNSQPLRFPAPTLRLPLARIWIPFPAITRAISSASSCFSCRFFLSSS